MRTSLMFSQQHYIVGEVGGKRVLQPCENTVLPTRCKAGSKCELKFMITSSSVRVSELCKENCYTILLPISSENT